MKPHNPSTVLDKSSYDDLNSCSNSCCSSAELVLDKIHYRQQRTLGKKHQECLAVWQTLLDRFEPSEFPSHELWTQVWGPGKKHAMGDFNSLKPAKQLVIGKNRVFYAQHKHIIDPWLNKIGSFDDTYKKLEWHIKGCKRLRIKDHLIQLRASGIRIKTSQYAPALVAIGQVPIQGWNNRYLPLTAMLELQCFPRTYVARNKRRIFKTLAREASMIKALGNAVNVNVVRSIASSLIE